MQKFIAVAPVGLLFMSLVIESQNRFTACLPQEIKPDEVVSTQAIKSPSGVEVVKKITVKQRLAEIKARCKKGKLVDTTGKEIRFYRLAGCWGNPPADYREILAQQQSELEEMKKRYRIIEIECAPLRETQ